MLTAAAVAAAALLVLSGRYGYHRDELYFLVSARRLAWGFVDQPPLTPAIARLAEAMAPDSLVALRAFPAAFTAVTVVLTGLCAREFGAGMLGQSAAAVGAAASPGLLGVGHLLSTSTLDVTLWVAIAFVVLRVLRTHDVRLWLPVGALVGIALLNKWTVGFLVVGLLVGILAGPERRLLASPWFAAGVVVASGLWLPNLLWQANRDWPQLDLFLSIQEESSGVGETILWFPLQLAIAGPVGSPLWIAGLLRVLRANEGRPYRALGLAYVALGLPLALLAGDKPYYVAALYLPLMGAGAPPFERWWARNAGRVRRAAVPAVLAVLTLVSVPIVLPLMPAATLADVPLQELNYDLGEQIGWPTFVDQVGDSWEAIPADERDSAAVLTASYGEAAAIERFGVERLPEPFSGHNTYWWWRTPPADTTTVLAVGFSDEYLGRFFGRLELVGAIDNGLDVENEEQGAPIWLCREPRSPLPDLWSELRHYN